MTADGSLIAATSESYEVIYLFNKDSNEPLWSYEVNSDHTPTQIEISDKPNDDGLYYIIAAVVEGSHGAQIQGYICFRIIIQSYGQLIYAEWSHKTE